MTVLASVVCLLLTAAPVRHSSAALPSSTVPFDANKIVAGASGPHLGATQTVIDSAEFMIDTTPSGYARKTSRAPAVAFNGENYLVVWTDDSLRGIIVPPNGIPDDPDGFKIAAASGVDPTVAACGTGFLVVWQQGYGPDIYGARVSGAGVVQDPNGFAISSAPRSQYSPSVASNDSLYLVAWHDGRINGRWLDIYAARVMPDRTVLDTQGIVVAACSSVAQPQKQLYPDVASDGTGFLIAWESNLCGGWDMRYARVTDSGAVLDPGGVLLTKEGDNATSATVAFDDSNYLVVWRRGPDISADIAGKRVTPGGVILDHNPIAIAPEVRTQEAPDVTFDDSNYLVTWQDSRDGAYDICCARVTPSGSVIDPEGLPVASARNDQETPTLAFGADKSLVTWLDRRNSQSKPHIYGTMVSRSGTVVGPDVVIPYPESVPLYCTQNYPAAAFDGTNYFVVWQDSQPGGSTWDIRGARVSSTGEVLDVPPIHISSDTDYQCNPAVAFGGSEYFVTWQDRRFGASSGWTIYGARVTTSGSLLDSGGILIQRHRGYNDITPAVAFDGTDFLVLWNEGWTYGRFINQSGQFLDSTPFPVTTVAGDKKIPCVVYGQGCFLVVWDDYRTFDYGRLYGVRLSSFGGRLDTGDLRLSGGGSPTVGSLEGDFATAWYQINNGTYSVAALHVSGDGVPDTMPLTVATGSGQRLDPSITSTEDCYVLAWQDSKHGNWDILGAKINSSLTECDTFRICIRPGDQTAPALVSGNNGLTLITFAGSVDSIGGRPVPGQRIWSKLLYLPGPMPPALLWPPDGYWFFQPPVWFLSDTAVHSADSFEFRVFRPGADTVWTHATITPCCTIPDTVLPNGTYSWQCRIHDRYGWSRGSADRHFDVQLAHPAVAEQAERRPLALRVPSFVPKQGRAVSFELSGIVGRAVVTVLDATGRTVRELAVTRDGPLLWKLEDATGRRTGAGVYFARLATDRRILTRKFVLTE
jgi:large repetitive protein